MGVDVSVLCCVVKIKEQIRKKYKEGRRGRLQKTKTKNPVGASFSALVQTGPGAHPAFCTIGYRVSFPGVKRPGRGVNHSAPSRAEVIEKVEL